MLISLTEYKGADLINKFDNAFMFLSFIMNTKSFVFIGDLTLNETELFKVFL